MAVRFDTAAPNADTEKALRMELVRNTIRSIHKQAADMQAAPKLADPTPPATPPEVPPINPNPRRHDVVAWRHDSARIDSTRHETKEKAIEFARNLSWVIYRQYMVMDGRDTVEFRSIPIPEGMALDDSDMPVAI